MASFHSDHSYMMPAHFGGRVAPAEPSIYDDTSALTVFYESDAGALAALLPAGFSLDRPEVMVSTMENRGVRWMGGEPYNIVSVNVAARWDAEDLPGWYCLVVWENNATPILTGREQTGIPKIYGEVEGLRVYPDSSVRTWSHYGGHTHCEMAAISLRDATDEETESLKARFSDMDWFGHRFIPTTGMGGAALNQATLFPQSFDITQVQLGEPALEWSPPPLHKNPTQAHIIGTLAALPNKGFTAPAVMMQAKAILRGNEARILGDIAG